MERTDVAIIGAGLVGAAIGFELASRGVGCLVLEASAEIAAGASRSNSGVVHTGFDSPPGSFETAMIRSETSALASGVDGSDGVRFLPALAGLGLQ